MSKIAIAIIVLVALISSASAVVVTEEFDQYAREKIVPEGVEFEVLEDAFGVASPDANPYQLINVALAAAMFADDQTNEDYYPPIVVMLMTNSGGYYNTVGIVYLSMYDIRKAQESLDARYEVVQKLIENMEKP